MKSATTASSGTPVAGDEDAGLAGGAEGRGHAARPHRRAPWRGRCTSCRSSSRCPWRAAAGRGAAGRRRSGSAARAAARRGAAGRAPSRSRPASARRAAGCAGPRRGRARPERRLEHLEPGGGDHAAAVGDADDERPRAGGGRFGDAHVGEAHVGAAALHPVLADRRLGAPVADALGDLRRQRIRGVAEEQEIGGLDHRREPSAAAGFFQIETDRPRTPPFKPAAAATGAVPDKEADMGHLRDGVWHKGALATTSRDGEFRRKASVCRNWITADGAPGPNGGRGFPAESGRYHLYVSYACPWAHRTLIFRALKGLEPARLGRRRAPAARRRRLDLRHRLPRRDRRPARRAAVPARGLPRPRPGHHQPGDGAGALGQGDRDDRLERVRPRSSGC